MTITDKVIEISDTLRPGGSDAKFLYFSFQTDSVEFHFRVRDKDVAVSLTKEYINEFSVMDCSLEIKMKLISKYLCY